MTPYPANLPADSDWRLLAECGPDTADLFFPTDEESPTDRTYREAAAKRICACCPVVAACAAEFGQLLAAGPRQVDHPDRGIWAGTTPTDRTHTTRAPRTPTTPGRTAVIDPATVRRLAAAGASTAEIARRFGVTARTVQRTRTRQHPDVAVDQDRAA